MQLIAKQSERKRDVSNIIMINTTFLILGFVRLIKLSSIEYANLMRNKKKHQYTLCLGATKNGLQK